MGMIVLAIVCGVLANELFAWGPRLSDLLLKIAVDRMSPKLQERMREEWQAHLDALPGGLSKLSASAGFLLSTFWGFRRYREDETPVEIEERIALEVAIALTQERERIRSVLEALKTEADAALQVAHTEVDEKLKKLLRRADENRTQLVKRRIFVRKPGRASGPWPRYRYKTTLHKGRARKIAVF
jgi:hypothetical protein